MHGPMKPSAEMSKAMSDCEKMLSMKDMKMTPEMKKAHAECKRAEAK